MTTNRISLSVALFVIAALAAFSISMLPRVSATSPKSSPESYLQQRRGEWTAGVSAEQAYLEQRHGEQTTGRAVAPQVSSQQFRNAEQNAATMDAQQAYLEYREGEWTAGTDPLSAYLEQRRGEWSGN